MFGSVELLVYTFVVFQLYLIVLKLVYLIRIKHLFIEIMNLGCFILSVNLFEINVYDSLQIPIKVRFSTFVVTKRTQRESAGFFVFKSVQN